MKTDKHDKIHLWFNEDENVNLFVRFMRDQVGSQIFIASEERYDEAFDADYRKDYKDMLQEIEDFEFSEKDIEVPIFHGKVGAHTNTIDNIIKVSVRGPGTTYRLGLHPSAQNVKRYHTRDLQFELKVLSEYKPELNRISNFLGQIRVYLVRLRQQENYHPHTIITPVLVTLDQNRLYDSMIEKRGITIFRLEYDDYKERVVTPQALLMKYAEPQQSQPESQERLTE